MANVGEFELDWMGGVAERHFRKVRPGVEAMPWGTLRPADFSPDLVDRARTSWTEAAFNEYCTAAAFARLVEELLHARAPLDLIGMASDFLADEVLHVELTSRLAMELGGGAPKTIDYEDITVPLEEGLDAVGRANERVVVTCCVAEAFSVPMLAGCLSTAGHPLTRAVLERIVQDEAPHGRFGWLYLDWAAPHMSPAERERLARVALGAIEAYSIEWRECADAEDVRRRRGFSLAHVRALGWMDPISYAERARKVVRDDVVAPLSRYGIVVDAGEIDRLLAPG
jgi:hypothetical protein